MSHSKGGLVSLREDRPKVLFLHQAPSVLNPHREIPDPPPPLPFRTSFSRRVFFYFPRCSSLLTSLSLFHFFHICQEGGRDLPPLRRGSCFFFFWDSPKFPTSPSPPPLVILFFYDTTIDLSGGLWPAMFCGFPS